MGRPHLRRLLHGTSYGSLIVAGVLPGFLTASLAPRIRHDFSFGDSVLGLAVATFYLTCMLSSTPGGHLVERIGARRGMQLGAGAHRGLVPRGRRARALRSRR